MVPRILIVDRIIGVFLIIVFAAIHALNSYYQQQTLVHDDLILTNIAKVVF
jgi:hypothetical protein